MASLSFGLGPKDWLKMANPLKTVSPIASTGAAPKPVTLGTSTTKPTTAPSPIAGAPAPATVPGAAPAPSAGTWGNILPTQPQSAPAPTPAPAPLPAPQGATGAGGAGGAGSSAPAPLAKVSANSTTPELKPTTTPAPTPVPQNQDVATAMPAGGQPITYTDNQAGQNQDVATAMPAASQPITFEDKGAPSQDVAAAPPQTMKDGGQGQSDGAGNVAPASQVVTPPKTEPSLDDNLKAYEQMAQDWMNGKVDEAAFKTTANRAILQMGLSNAADMDALKMRINSDPSLAGQGAGSAMLSMMSANQNFNADQLFGQLAESAQQKILDMQKYGLQQGVAINTQRRQNAFSDIQALQDAGDFTGAAKLLAKTVDFPGVTINPSQFTASRARTSEDIQNLMTAGDYEGAAQKLSAMTGSTVNAAQLQQRDPFVWTQAANLDAKGDFAGEAKLLAANGINVTADDLRARNPFQQQTWANTLESIKSIANTNPDRATAELALLMKNPAAASYLGFSSSMDPKDMIADIVSGKYAADQGKITTLNNEINLQVKSNVPFSQALANYKQQGPVAWQGFEDTGKKTAESNLDDFNKTRQAMGMGAVHKDAEGNIVDEQGNALTPDDFGETAAAADYLHRKDQVSAQPWQSVYDQMMAGPLKDKILSIPGGDQKVKEALQIMYLGGGYTKDPNTGLMEPDFTNGMPWDNPKTSYLFHAWPTAVFGEGGDVMGKYDVGGDPYGLENTDGSKLQKLPEDEKLDNLYAKYRYSGGNLSSTDWYFATAGGVMKPDQTKIPADVPRPTEDFQNVSLSPTNNTPGVVADSPAAVQSAFDSVLDAQGRFTDDGEKQLVKEQARAIMNAATNFNTGAANPLPSDYNGTYESALTRLKNKGVPVGTGTQGDAPITGVLNVDRSGAVAQYKGTPEFADYSIYASLLDHGFSEADAQKAVTSLIGADRMKKALALESIRTPSTKTGGESKTNIVEDVATGGVTKVLRGLDII